MISWCLASHIALICFSCYEFYATFEVRKVLRRWDVYFLQSVWHIPFRIKLKLLWKSLISCKHNYRYVQIPQNTYLHSVKLIETAGDEHTDVKITNPFIHEHNNVQNTHVYGNIILCNTTRWHIHTYLCRIYNRSSFVKTVLFSSCCC